MVIARSSVEETYRAQRLFTNKLNVILVQIVKQEWPHNWPSFISDIVNASKTNETLCENNMIILKLLSEEVRVHTQKKPSQAAPVASTHGLNPRPGLTAPALSLLTQVFDFSRDEMTSAKAKKLKESFNADFSLIFQVTGATRVLRPGAKG